MIFYFFLIEGEGRKIVEHSQFSELMNIFIESVFKTLSIFSGDTRA